jgi:hypothetical protein
LNDLVAASLNNPQQKALQWSEVKVLLRQAQQDYDDAKDNERQLSREVREARYTYEDILIRYKLQHEIYTNALNQLVRNPLKSLLQEKTVRKGVTDSNGKIYFDNLQPGFYGILLRDGDGTERFMRNQLVSGVNKFNQNIQEIPLFVNTCGTMEDPSVLALAPMPENTPVKTTNKVDSEKQTGVAKVVLYRNNPDYTSLRSYHFFIDGKDVGKVKVGEQLSFDLPPGPHVFYIKIGYAKSEMLNFNLNPGQILRLRCYASTWAYKLVVDSNF